MKSAQRTSRPDIENFFWHVSRQAHIAHLARDDRIEESGDDAQGFCGGVKHGAETLPVALLRQRPGCGLLEVAVTGLHCGNNGFDAAVDLHFMDGCFHDADGLQDGLLQILVDVFESTWDS